MIKLTLDPGFCFDLLSILNVKVNKTSALIKEKNVANFQFTAREIKEQIGEMKFNEVMGSQEYRDLYYINEVLYNLVDEVKKHDGIAKMVDDNVYKRFLAKKALQQVHFGTEIKEVKIGYEKKTA